MSDSVPEDVKQRRLREIIDVFRSNAQRRNIDNESGRLRLVLVEGLSTRSEKELMTPGQGDIGDNQKAQIQKAILSGKDLTLTGRTDGNKRIIFPARAVLSSLQGFDLESWASKERHHVTPSQRTQSIDLVDWVNESALEEGKLTKQTFAPVILKDIPYFFRPRRIGPESVPETYSVRRRGRYSCLRAGPATAERTGSHRNAYFTGGAVTITWCRFDRSETSYV